MLRRFEEEENAMTPFGVHKKQIEMSPMDWMKSKFGDKAQASRLVSAKKQRTSFKYSNPPA